MTETPPAPQITSPEIERYLDQIQGITDPLLEEMDRAAQERGFPRLARINARLLGVLVRIVGAKSILELGSGFGWSALWMARSMPSDGRITLTDLDPKNLEEARGWLERAGLADRADYVAGDALEALARCKDGTWDLIFMDIEKSQYLSALEAAVPKLKSGGLLCVDNALWHGLVAAAGSPADEKTAAVMAFNRAVAGHPMLESLILPAGDGFSVSVKVSG